MHGSSMEINPTRGNPAVDMQTTGCPQIDRSLALQLIDDWERRAIQAKVARMNAEVKDDLAAWMEELVEAHPVLRQLPGRIKDRLVVRPTSWNDIPGNKHARKRWNKED